MSRPPSAPPGLILRPLYRATPVVVTTRDGAPATLVYRGGRHRVEEVADRWLIEDEWWRAPISRMYYRLLLACGLVLTVYQDRETGRWFEQPYHGPVAA